MNKKNVLTKTILFIAIILFINVFTGIFGDANKLLGVGIITVALCLLERDLTTCLWANLSKLLVINLILGISAFLSCGNIWIGIIINFLVLFTLGYLFSYNLRKSMVAPFGLQYLFMLYTPVYGNDFSKRILALAFGALFTMAIQLLVNKDKMSKVGMKKVDNILENVLLKLNLLKDNLDLNTISLSIEESIETLKKMVYDKRVKNFYLTNDGKIITNIICTIERFNILLDKLKLENKNENYIYFLGDLYTSLKNIKNKNYNSNNLSVNYLNIDSNMLYVQEFKNIIETLSSLMCQMENLNKKNKISIDYNERIPNHFQNLHIQKRNFNIRDLRVSYGVKLGIAGALTAFITQYFKLPEGRWLTYTIFALIQPYSENCKIKSRQRIEGTLIGALLIIILFTLIKKPNARFLIILLTGYLNPFATNYKYLVICITVSSIATIALSGDLVKITFIRIMFVIIGTGIALLINKFILPYKIKDGSEKLVKIYNELVNQMTTDIKDRESEHGIMNLFLLPAFIQDRMELINFGKDCSKEKDFINNQRILVNSIYYNNLSVNMKKCISEL
ncbi:MAG TPA: FUSC family protein [Clostridium sp.]|nr:FUSC family protein [Clostridium sp.]